MYCIRQTYIFALSIFQNNTAMLHTTEFIFEEEIVKLSVEIEEGDEETNTSPTLTILEPIFEDSHSDEFRTSFLQYIEQNERQVINSSWEYLANQ